MTASRSGAPAARGRVPGPTNCVFVLAEGLTDKGAISIDDAISIVLAEWAIAATRGELATSTLETHTKVLRTFAKYAKAYGAATIADIDSELIQLWATSPAARSKNAPTSNMVDLRRSVIRSLYRTMALLGITDLDITVTIARHRKPPRVVNPLTEAQVDKLKEATVRTRGRHSGSSKAPAALALALLGLQSQEIPNTRVCDVNLLDGTVWAHDGGIRFIERHVPIDDAWAFQALAERIQYLQREHGLDANEMSVAYEAGKGRGGKGAKNPGAATANTLDRIFADAGVKQPGRVRIASLNEYVALRVYAQTNSFVEVAARMGMRSLDAVAHIVDDNWLAKRLAEGVK